MSASHLRQTQLRHSRYAQLAIGDVMEQYGEDRVCTHPECNTKLSRYNPSGTCTLHAGWKDTRKRNYG